MTTLNLSNFKGNDSKDIEAILVFKTIDVNKMNNPVKSRTHFKRSLYCEDMKSAVCLHPHYDPTLHTSLTIYLFTLSLV